MARGFFPLPSSSRLSPASSCARRCARRTATSVAAAASPQAASSLTKLLFNGKTAALLAGVAVALGVANASAFKRGPFSRPVEKAWSRRVEEKLSEPSVPEALGVASADARGRGTLVPRPAAAAALASALDPDDAGAFYYVVYGPAGCGKTTLVREALRARASGGRRRDEPSAAAASSASEPSSPAEGRSKETARNGDAPRLPSGGAAYVDAASSFPLDFGRELAAAIGFSFEEGLRTADRIAKALGGGGLRALVSSSSAGSDGVAGSGLSSSPQQRRDSLARAAAALEEAAESASASGKGRPLVVVDGADKLAALDPDAFLDVARVAAKWAASSGGGATPVVALVIGDPSVLRLLRASPSASRALLEPPISVPGPTDDEASAFLSSRGVPREESRPSPSSEPSWAPSPAPSPELRSSPQQPIIEAARGDWLSLEKAARIVRSRDAARTTAAEAAVEAARELVVGPSERRFAAAGLLDGGGPGADSQQSGGLAAVRALCMLRQQQRQQSRSSWPSSPPPRPQPLPPALWRAFVPVRQHQEALLLLQDPSSQSPRPPPGTKPCLRYVEGEGLSFSSAADEAFACSTSLGGGGEGASGGGPSPPLLRCLGDRRVWEVAGRRAAEALRARGTAPPPSSGAAEGTSDGAGGGRDDGGIGGETPPAAAGSVPPS